jgi:hypothetical protein
MLKGLAASAEQGMKMEAALETPCRAHAGQSPMAEGVASALANPGVWRDGFWASEMLVALAEDSIL